MHQAGIEQASSMLQAHFKHASRNLLSFATLSPDKCLFLLVFPVLPGTSCFCFFKSQIKILSVAGHQMPGNCRNISDEVWTGIHVGDK